MAARAARSVDPGSAIGGRRSARAASVGIGRRWIPARAPAARRSARAAIIGTQKKTPGAGPGARGSRIAAGGSGVELVDQIEHSCKRGLRLVGPAAGQHQDCELELEPDPARDRRAVVTGRGDVSSDRRDVGAHH